MQNTEKRADIDTAIRVTVPEVYYQDKKLLQDLLEGMLLTRKFEEKVQWLFAQGLVHGTAHLGVGEEATGIGTTYALSEEDYMLATHRGHGQAIGKGCSLNNMMAEILSKDAGQCRGRGGSMHIADFDRGILGANGIVGGNAPLACGAALTCKRKGLKRICMAFTGDGSMNEGAVMESLNLAAAWQLPVVFAVINNTYGMSTSLSKASFDTDLSKRAIPFGMRCYEVDGNDVLAVYETARQAREYVLTGKPAMIIQHTYRISGHSKSDGNLYRSKEEIAMWKEKCPIKRYRKELLERGCFTEDELALIDQRTTELVEAAVEFAKASPEPTIDTVLNNVYAD